MKKLKEDYPMREILKIRDGLMELTRPKKPVIPRAPEVYIPQYGNPIKVWVNGKKQLMHRVVMEKYIQRKLRYNEVVIHRDGDRRNNNISNLELMSRTKCGEYYFRKLPTSRREEVRKIIRQRFFMEWSRI